MMTTDEIVKRLVKPLVWVPYCPLGDQGKYGNGLFNYEIKEGGPGSFWWRQAGSGSWHQPERDTSFAAAQAAAETDYRARIAAALDLEPVVKLVEKAAQDAREVFEGHKRAKEAVDYMEQLLLAALAASGAATGERGA